MAEELAPWEDDPQIPEKGAMIQPGMPGYRDETGKLADPYGNFVESWQQAPGKIDKAARAAARGMSFGGSDVIAGKVNEMTGMPIYPGGMTVEDQQMTTALGIDELGAAGRLSEVAGGIVPGLLLPGGSAASAARSAATGAAMATGAAVAQSYFDTGDLPPAAEVIPGAILGAVLGGTGYALGKTVQRPRLNPTQDQNVNLLAREGVDVFEGQALNDPKLLKKEASASGAFEASERQASQFSTAAFRRAGIHTDTGRVDPQTLTDAFNITGQRMDALAARNNMQFQVNPQGRIQVLDDMRDIARDYYNSVEGKPASIINNTIRDIGRAASHGVLTGAKFQEITSGLEAAARSNPRLAPTVRQMRMTLNHAMEDYIVSTNQADAGLWRAANQQYANLLVVEDALGKAGARSANGMITPQSLAAATKKIRGTRNYTRGNTAFDDLARAGVAAMAPLPIGQNAPASELSRMLSRKIAMLGSGGMAGASAMGMTGSPMTGIAAGVAATALPDVANWATSGLRLAPVNSLIPNAGSMGGRAGAALAPPAQDEMNPFLKAQGL